VTIKDVSGSHGRGGQPRAMATCDDCGREEVFACEKGNKGHAVKRIQQMGWSIIAGKHRCQLCEAKRKVVTPMNKVPDADVDAAPRAPTLQQKRQIMDLLKEVYDVEAGRYMAGETDSTVAAVVTGVMPGWVSEIREGFFGPDGGSEDMDNLRESIEALQERLSRHEEAARQALCDLEKAEAELLTLKGEFGRLRSAVGTHVVKRAGLK
jgi:uncharacterized Zn finger protein (UPF0148 family)